MAVKFDDFAKVATEVLNDDYQSSGYTLKTKQKVSFQDIVYSSQVDMFPEKGDVRTPAKIAIKWPAPFGLKGCAIDKFEIDKSGKFKCETSADKLYNGVKVEVKSDLVNADKVTAGLLYTGLKDTRLLLECKPMNPKDFTAEATSYRDKVTVGCKFTGAAFSGLAPDMGLRALSGPMFACLTVKNNFGNYAAHLTYKASSDVKCAATYQKTTGKDKGKVSYSFGVLYKNLYRVRVSHDKVVSCSAKHSLAKGFNLLGGASFNVAKGTGTFGVQVSIE